MSAPDPLITRAHSGDLVGRFGQAKTDMHVRLYVSHASPHSGNALNTKDGAEVLTGGRC